MKQQPKLVVAKPTTIDASHSFTGEAVERHPSDLPPMAVEVAQRAYFRFVSQGSQTGYDVQHWLEAERQLIAERGHVRM